MSSQSNPAINAAQAPASSANVSADALSDEQLDTADALSDEELDAISGGAVVIGNGGFDTSLTPIRRRVLITN